MIKTQVLKYLPGTKESDRGESKGDVRGEAMEKSRYVRVIEWNEIEEMTQILPTGSAIPFESQRR